MVAGIYLGIMWLLGQGGRGEGVEYDGVKKGKGGVEDRSGTLS